MSEVIHQNLEQGANPELNVESQIKEGSESNSGFKGSAGSEGNEPAISAVTPSVAKESNLSAQEGHLDSVGNSGMVVAPSTAGQDLNISETSGVGTCTPAVVENAADMSPKTGESQSTGEGNPDVALGNPSGQSDSGLAYDILDDAGPPSWMDPSLDTPGSPANNQAAETNIPPAEHTPSFDLTANPSTPPEEQASTTPSVTLATPSQPQLKAETSSAETPSHETPAPPIPADPAAAATTTGNPEAAASAIDSADVSCLSEPSAGGVTSPASQSIQTNNNTLNNPAVTEDPSPSSGLTHPEPGSAEDQYSTQLAGT